MGPVARASFQALSPAADKRSPFSTAQENAHHKQEAKTLEFLDLKQALN